MVSGIAVAEDGEGEVVMCEQCEKQKNDDLRWLALLVRQGLKVIVVGIEQRYGLRSSTVSEKKESGKAA